MSRILHLFPELANIDQGIINEVCEESKLYQLNALRVLNDLQHSYQLCWMVQITKRCAQMLLKYESIAIIRLSETGMLDESEYSHICELIKNKMFTLEYSAIQLPAGRKKTIGKAFDLLALFRTLSDNERIYWESLMKRKHRWLEPGTVLLERYQIVSVAYIIVRGIVQCKDDTVLTYYTSGNIVGIEALFSHKDTSESLCTYSVNDGLVEVYIIDSDLLDTMLADENMSREIYIEIALHLLTDKYQPQFKLNHAQFKLLLNEKAILLRNKADLTIHLKVNDRLFLLAGTLICTSDQQNDLCNSPLFVSFDASAMYRLNCSSIVFTWTEEDEISYLNVENYKEIFHLAQSQSTLMDTLYPHYLRESIKLIPRRQSMQVTPLVRNFSHLQFIPFVFEDDDELTSPLDLPIV
jgi:hypothetical protein